MILTVLYHAICARENFVRNCELQSGAVVTSCGGRRACFAEFNSPAHVKFLSVGAKIILSTHLSMQSACQGLRNALASILERRSCVMHV